MPWEVRGQQRYFYKAVRIDGLPRRMYLGTGPAGRLHEILDRQLRRRNQSVREERLRIVEEIADDDRSWRAIWSWIRALTASTYLIAGYYEHHGEWRPIMGRPHTRENAPPVTPGEAADYQMQLEMLNARANSREPGAMKELKAFIEQHPEVWETIGDLSAASRIASITRLAGADSALREAVTRNLDCWMEELIGSNPTPIERAIGEAAVSAKLALIYAETHAASGNDAVAVAAMKARRLERAQNRFNATLKNLAQVQRMTPRREMAAPVPPTAPPLAQAG